MHHVISFDLYQNPCISFSANQNIQILISRIAQTIKIVMGDLIPITTHRLQLHDAIYRPDSFVSMLRCVSFKAIRYESTSLNRIVADKSHRVIVAINR